MKIEPTPSELSELFIRGFKPIDEATRFKLSSIACSCAARPDIYDENTCENGMWLYNLLVNKDPVFPVFIKRFDLNLIAVAESFSYREFVSLNFHMIWTAFSVKLAGDKRITATEPNYSLINVLKLID